MVKEGFKHYLKIGLKLMIVNLIAIILISVVLLVLGVSLLAIVKDPFNIMAIAILSAPIVLLISGFLVEKMWGWD